MAISKQACKNHPDKFTSRRCYYCKDHICQQCHQHKFHHLFCSIKCAVLWRIKEILSIFQVKKELVWFIIIVLISNLSLYFMLAGKINSVEDSTIATVDSTDLYNVPPGFTIDSIRYAVQNKFTIKVAAPPYQSLTLIKNGDFLQSLIPGSGDFSFEDVKLNNGNNVFAIWGLNSKGKSFLVDSFSVYFKSPRLDYLMQPVYRIKSDRKLIALTFDGGSGNKGTKEILDILRTENIKCTVFLTGQFIENFPELTGQILRDGHEIGNHSFSHPHFTNVEVNGQNSSREKVDRRYLQQQLIKSDSIFAAKFNKRMQPYWRAPFGEINKEILFWAAELGYRHIGWSYKCDSWDWVADSSSEFYRSAEQIKVHFLSMEEEKGLQGKILLMHLGSERKNNFPYLSLRSLISELKNRGYTFKKISELLKV